MNVSSYRKLLPLMMACFISLISGCSVAPQEDPYNPDESAQGGEQIGETSLAVTQSTINWWKGLWQPSRDILIFWRANSDLTTPPKYVGLNCKDWARKVVLDASQNVVNLPFTNATYDWMWDQSSYVQNMGSIFSAQPGNIVQMHRNSSGLHTAIVYGNNGMTITWIDSNWKLDGKVIQHSESIASFIAAVTANGVQKYNVYRITGG